MKTTEEMIALNREQAGFYDSISEAEDQRAEVEGIGHAHNKAAGALTRFWASLRHRQQNAARQSGAGEAKDRFHREWLQRKQGGDFLEVGCFRGTNATFPLIEYAGTYTGIELSAKAVQALQRKLKDANLAHKAKAIAMDFLTMDESVQFDVVFAHGVLHHFENPDPLFRKIQKLLKKDGVLIFTEPSAANPLYRFIRALYRPIQTDAQWEWPFTERTISALNRYLEPVEGFGWGKYSLPVSIAVGIPVAGSLLRPVYMKLVRSELAQGLNGNVWMNSTITAVYKPKLNQ